MKCKNHFKYFHYYPKGSENFKKQGHYIKKEEIKLAHLLAQKEYEERTLECISKQKSLLQKMLSDYNENAVRDIYINMHPGKRAIIQPIELSDEEFIKNWESFEYEHKAVNLLEDLYTEKYERVRSKSEVIIANKLFNENIPYRYEQPLKLTNYGLVHPDFTILNTRTRKEILWEHCGMMDSERYYNDFVKRVNAYQMNGYYIGENLILTFESIKCPLNKQQIDLVIKRYLI